MEGIFSKAWNSVKEKMGWDGWEDGHLGPTTASDNAAIGFESSVSRVANNISKTTIADGFQMSPPSGVTGSHFGDAALESAAAGMWDEKEEIAPGSAAAIGGGLLIIAAPHATIAAGDALSAPIVIAASRAPTASPAIVPSYQVHGTFVSTCGVTCTMQTGTTSSVFTTNVSALGSVQGVTYGGSQAVVTNGWQVIGSSLLATGLAIGRSEQNKRRTEEALGIK